MSQNIVPPQLAQAVAAIKTAILQSQARTARNVNADVLALYYSVGGYISAESRKQKWGSGAIKTISEQLRKELPGLKGFSSESIIKMRRFFEEWNFVVFQSPLATIIQQPMAGEIQSPVATQLSVTPTKLDFQRNIFDIQTAYDFLSIGFTHHMEILFKTDTLEERLFYIRQAALYKWDKYKLRDYLKQDLFHHQLLYNIYLLFLLLIMFKDEYLLDYINIEEIGARDSADVDEKVVEQTIVQNVKNFIMMFGKDFTYVGNQYHLEKFSKDHFIDLLFFNRELTCLVAVELKLGEFKPIYLGQLQAYLQLLDDQIRKPNENPSIGIILCQDVDKSYVEYVIQRYNSPMGVAKYYTSVDMPEELRKALPDMEELKRLLTNNEQ